MNKITDGTASFIVRKIGGGGQLIKGIIMAFSGTFDSNGYPVNQDTNAGDTGWHICDGTHGTPDLRGRFILGASDGHVVGSTGGEENHTLTVEEMPSHNHTIHFYNDDWNQTDGDGGRYNQPGIVHDSVDRADKHTNRWPDLVENTGGGAAHNNMPPYYTLSYIMKI